MLHIANISALWAWPEGAIYLPWDAWVLSWTAAALWTARTVKRPALSANEIVYRIFAFGGFGILLFFQSQNSDDFRAGLHTHNPLVQRYWALPVDVGWAMVALCAFGFLFAWWARIHLGRLWSGRITRKEGHKVIDTGPYALVRHPIYTGIIIAAVATAAEKASPLAMIGALMLYIGYWMKARLEERFLREELGPNAYDAYRNRVPMLIPFGPKNF
ncbi:MAG TPA: isoprenylcysteine carboxylmethyltransferase family protein [Rhizomicrobium sp.]|jgi:protein-S-isoprenylcysteine O-methyltransferase Ste14